MFLMRASISYYIAAARVSMKSHVHAQPLPGLHHDEMKPTYSRVRCIGGSQAFPFMNPQRTQVDHGWPEANLARNRMCHFENVCWVNDHFVFYEDPRLRAATPDFLWPQPLAASSGGALLHLGYPEGTEWSPVIIRGPLPKDAIINSSASFLLSENSYSDNFAHLLIDDLIPSLQGLSVFGLPLESGLLLSLSACAKASRWYEPEGITPYAGRSRKEVCLDNYRKYTALVLGRPMLDIQKKWSGTTVCMKHLLAGHSSVFSLRTLDVERGPGIRLARDRIVQRLGLDTLPRPTSHRVVVLGKQAGFNGGPIWPSLCEDTKVTMAMIDADIPIRCFDPVEQSLVDQVRTSRESTLIVAEQGTTSYAGIYGHDGLVLLSISTRQMVKDMQIFLYTTHIDTYYMAHEDKDAHFEGMLRFALARASANFRLDDTTT